MCGLVGVAGKIENKQKEVFKTLLALDTLRGPHSTGVASVRGTGEWDVTKKKGCAWDLFDTKDYANNVTTGVYYALIGHNRYATKGKINNINAHPFEFEDVVGGHNGTIRNQYALPDHLKFEVDSENIFYAIQKDGVEETLPKLDGAYALSYWDKRDETLVLLRNNQRTLFYVFSEDRKTVYWASEKWMLTVAISRAGLKHGNVIDLSPGHIYRFDFERKFHTKDIEVRIAKFEEYVAPKKHPVVCGGGQGRRWENYSKPAGKKGPDWAELDALRDTVAEFTVEGPKQNVHKQWYILGKLKQFPEVDCKVFATKGSPLWDELTAGYDVLFEGEISSVQSFYGALSVNFKLGSIQTVEEDGDEEDVILGYNNRHLTLEEFDKITKVGCAWCSDQPVAEEAPDLHWISPDAFVCPDCQVTADVKDHIGGGKK